MVYVTKILFDVKFFQNYSMCGYDNDVIKPYIVCCGPIQAIKNNFLYSNVKTVVQTPKTYINNILST